MPSEIQAKKPQELMWLTTRDGSPTLWSNELSESYRSLRGAFTESYWAFVRPALEAARLLAHGLAPVQVGEFGLGLGTNWLLWTQLATEEKLPFEYTAIEKNPETFMAGVERWKQEYPLFKSFSEKIGRRVSEADYLKNLEKAQDVKIIPSPDALALSSSRFDVWFHDPFGAEVNPEGYSLETLTKVSKNWSPQIRGFSYACNRPFQSHLKSLGFQVDVLDFEEPIGKRSRLTFGA